MIVTALAEKFPWPESFILWELPLSRALQYFHAIQSANPWVWTVSARYAAGEAGPGAGVSAAVVASALAAREGISLE